MILDFNKDWQFNSSNGKSATVDLPHDAMITERRYAECRSGVSGAYFSGGVYTYEKILNIEENQIGKYIALHFEGVYQNATVYLNDEKVAFHKYGYTEFTVDISDKVKVGDNTVKVVADNSLVPNCRWYTGSGIYRPVWLEICEKERIENIVVKTLSYTQGTVVITATSATPVICEIYDGDIVVAKGGLGKFMIENAKLWDEDNPHLYTLKLKRVADERTVKFGIRKIEWNAEKGLLINGKQTLLRGGCIHHDNGVLGACTYYDAEYRRVKILKEQGFNAIRVSHNPASRYLLQACDELGMYVLDEAFDGWYIPKEYHDYSRAFWENYKADLSAMVQKDNNHPSVIMYSIGNEVTESCEEKGIKLAAKMRDFVKTIDDTRAVTCGVNILIDVYAKMGIGVYKDKGTYKADPLPEDKKYKEKKSGSAFFNAIANKLGKLMFFMSKGKKAEKIARDFAPSVDILGLNYASSRYDRDVKKYPERLMLGTETMAHELPYNWERVKKYPQLLGDFVWAAWDYLGEACIGDWTYHSYKGLPLLAGQGMIDITGKPLASMAYMQVVWGMRKEPFIAVRPLNHAEETSSTGAWQFTNAVESWNWKPYNNSKAIVEVYSQGKYVELYLNGKRIGRKKLKDYKAIFKVKYKNGAIDAVSFDEKGSIIAKSSLVTGGKAKKIAAKTDKTVIAEGELIFAEIEITDENDNIVPYEEKRVEIRKNGSSVKLLGFGSALCKTDELFDKPYHNAYRGRCLAVFKGMKKGVSEFTVSYGDLVPVTIKAEVK